MTIYKLPRNIRMFRHIISPHKEMKIFDKNVHLDMPTIKICDTPVSNTTCTCGKYNYLWAQNIITMYILAKESIQGYPACLPKFLLHFDHDLLQYTTSEQFISGVLARFWYEAIGYPPQELLGKMPVYNRELYNAIMSVVPKEDV